MPLLWPNQMADSNVMWREFVRKICDWERKNGALLQNMQQTLKVCILLRVSLVLFEAIIAEYINDHKLCVFTCFIIPCVSFYFFSTSFNMAQWPLLGSAGPVKEDRGLTDKITPRSTGSQCSRRSPVMGEVFIDVFFFRRNEIRT